MKKILYMVFVALLTAMAGTAWGQDRTLRNIPTGWTVKANGSSVDVTNGTATIPAGATVTLTPTYPDRVKSVKLVDDSPLSGKFSVSATKQVQFSRGNLQATCSSADGNSSTQETWTWHFAEHQWDYIGNAAANNSINGNGSVSTAGTVDLFGWVGASSTWEGAAQYGITNSTEHEGGTDGYGNNETESLKSDWGNTIGTGWRTLTSDEWKYLFENHTKGWSTVNGVNGYVIRPDGVSTAIAASYTASDWAAEEAAGSVFLPATGYRQGTEVNNVGSHGNYWSSSPKTSEVRFAYRLYFSDSNLDPQSSYYRFFGYPVRLVKDAPAPTTSCTGKTINLQYVSSDTVAKDCDTLTGTLAAKVKISIADGATVTLDGVSINASGTWTTGNYAGITCAGDATIILSGTNTVKGFYENYPGIQAAAGKTLTINGTGSLTASSNGYSAGIGGGRGVACGNIEIQGGTITATGGERGAGIGGAYNASWGNITISGGTVIATGGEQGAGIGGGRRFTADVSCGNIYISGGTVTATGGNEAAGIGGGRGNNPIYQSSCGTITITTGVTKVTATKGSDDANSIGAGNIGTCGTVTIGGVVGAITTSPYTYPSYTMAKDATTSDKGKLICTAGHIHAYGEDAACTEDRVAMICYVGDDAETNTTYNHGLALALEDASNATMWCSQFAVTCLTTQYVDKANAITDIAGIANTDYLIGNDPDGHGHDAASVARSNNSTAHPTGTSDWFLPSAGQWEKMINACKNVLGTNNNYTDLRDGFSTRGGTNLQSDYYWSSTEASDDRAWLYKFGDDYSPGEWGGYYKDNWNHPNYVRSAIAF